MDITLGLSGWIWILAGLVTLYIDRHHEYKSVAGAMFIMQYPWVLQVVGIAFIIIGTISFGFWNTA